MSQIELQQFHNFSFLWDSSCLKLMLWKTRGIGGGAMGVAWKRARRLKISLHQLCFALNFGISEWSTSHAYFTCWSLQKNNSWLQSSLSSPLFFFTIPFYQSATSWNINWPMKVFYSVFPIVAKMLNLNLGLLDKRGKNDLRWKIFFLIQIDKIKKKIQIKKKAFKVLK